MNSLLPPNATKGEQAMGGTVARISNVPVPIADLWNPYTCPEDQLPWLAWALAIGAWKSYWPIGIKRARVAAAIDIARRKGSTQSVEDVVNSFGGSVVLTEWFQMSPPGIPATFTLQITLSGADGEEPSAEFVDDVIAEVNRTKNTRSHFTFNQVSAFTGRIGIVAVIRPCIYRQLTFQAEAA
jgi:phage tail P2-like protein